MKKIIFVIYLGLFSFWNSACTDPFAKEEFMAYEELPLGMYLESRSEYSKWVQLLKTADVFNAINMSNLRYTCFVVNNEAVDKYIESVGRWNSIEDLTEEEAKNIVNFHIVPIDYAYGSLASGRLGTKTVSDDYLTIHMDLTGRYIALAEGKMVKILSKDEEGLDEELGGSDFAQINGYYHEVEGVLDPIIYTVMELLEQKPNYTIFAEAMKKTGLNEYLNRKEIIFEDTELREYRTVFAVTDSVFHKNGIMSFADLNKEFEGEPTDINSEIFKYTAFHILVDEAYDYGALTEFVITSSKGTNFQTYVDGEFVSLEVNEKGDSVFLNPLGNEKDLQISSHNFNIQGSNGFIHDITGLMPVSEPVRYKFEWEPTEWPEFQVIPFYRKERARDGSAEMYWFEEETEHIRWQTIPYKEKAVAYKSHDTDYDRFKHDDMIYASLGEVGWIEFDTPTLMRGTYKVEVEKWRWNEGTGGGGYGLFHMYIDGLRIGPQMDFRKDTDETLNMGNFTFYETKPYVFRFRVSGLLGELAIDRFIFTPVN